MDPVIIMAKLFIKHLSQDTKVNSISIFLDGKHIGDIQKGGFLEFPLIAGKKFIQAKIGTRQSEKMVFNIEDRERIQFSVWGDGRLLKVPMIKKDFQEKLKKRFMASEAPLQNNQNDDTIPVSNKIEWQSILGVNASSNDAQIHRAFINLMKENHPDKTINMSEDEKKISNSRAADATMAYAYIKKIRKIT